MKRVKMKMSLEEIKLELQKLETRLADLKQQKHQLFSQLKKVLNEDVVRRRNRDLQWMSSSDALFADQMAANSVHNSAAILTPIFAPQQMPPFNAPFFVAQQPTARSVQNFGPKFAPKAAPPTPPQHRPLKRPHEMSVRAVSPPPPPQNYKTSVTYTPAIGKSEFNQFYGMMTSQMQRKYF